MEMPWVVSTGVSYSKATLDKLLDAAEARGVKPICPQTKQPIEGAGCPNVALQVSHTLTLTLTLTLALALALTLALTLTLAPYPNPPPAVACACAGLAHG